MPSLVRQRRIAEWALHGSALALIVWMLGASVRPTTPALERRAGDGPALADSLRAWSADARAESLSVALDTAPGPLTRDWLHALARGGSRVTWSAAHVAPLAMAVVPLADPVGGARVIVTAPRGAHVRVSDQSSLLDSATTAGASVSFVVPEPHGVVSAMVTGPGFGTTLTARAALHDTLLPRAVLVIGAAGWESKFVIAALEERGWPVRARLRVTPTLVVAQGAPALDTAHVAAVVALDSTAAADGASIARFVRNGGGLVLAGRAAAAPPLRALAAGGVGPRVPAASITFASDAPRRGLGFWSIAAVSPDAIPLETRDGRLVAAARRVGAGRVVQVGFDDTWRWRLGGNDAAPAAHRAWWSAVIASAAYRAERPLPTPVSAALENPAPFAATVAALGPPAPFSLHPQSASHSRAGGGPLRPWVLSLILILLLIEWASRRLRGVS